MLNFPAFSAALAPIYLDETCTVSTAIINAEFHLLPFKKIYGSTWLLAIKYVQFLANFPILSFLRSYVKNAHWDKFEQATHLSNSIPCNLFIYLSIYL